MALSFDPRLDSSGSRSKRGTKQKNTAAKSRKTGRKSLSQSHGTGAQSPSAGASRRSARGTSGSRSSVASKPIKGKRKSVAGKTKAAKAHSDAAKSARRSSVARESGEKEASKARRSSVAKGKRSSVSDSAASSREGRRVGDIRAAERQQRNRSIYRRYILRIVAVVAAVLLVFFGCIFAYRSDLFHVDNVKVTGVSHLTSDEITKLAAVSSDSTLLRLDTSGIINRLKENAWVQEARVSRVFPDTIQITIVEREQGAVVRVSDKATWVVSKDGAWLSAATEDDWKTCMRIVDVSKSLSQPISGSDCDDGGIKNALAIIEGISDDLKGKIKSISAESSIKTSLNLSDGVEVAFGDSSNIQLKEAAIDELLTKYKGKISYINVRVPSRPTFRTLDSTDTAESDQSDS